MKFELRRGFARSFVSFAVIAALTTADLLPAANNINRSPQAESAETSSDLEKSTAHIDENVQKSFKEAYILYRSLRWPKAPKAISFTNESASAEFQRIAKQFQTGLAKTEIAINSFKPSKEEERPGLRQLGMVPDTLRYLLLAYLLLNPGATQSDVKKVFADIKLRLEKTPALDTSITLIEGNEKVPHPLKALDRETQKIHDKDFVVLGLRDKILDATLVAHRVANAKNPEDLLPLIQNLLARELLVQYGSTSKALDVRDPFKDLESMKAKLAELRLNPANYMKASSGSNVAGELAAAFRAAKIEGLLDISAEPAFRDFLSKAFSRLGEDLSKLPKDVSDDMIKDFQQAIFKSVKERQEVSNGELADRISRREIPIVAVTELKKIADDFGLLAGDLLTQPYKDYPTELIQHGVKENSITEEELSAFLKGLSAAISKNYSEKILAWLSKNAPKNESNAIDRIVISMKSVAELYSTLPEGEANIGLIMQLMAADLAALKPRERTVVAALKELPAQENFSDARSRYRQILALLEEAVAQEGQLGIGSKTFDEDLADFTMENRKKDLDDWKSVGVILGFDTDIKHPTLREWMHHTAARTHTRFLWKGPRYTRPTVSTTLTYRSLEKRAKQILLTQAMNVHPILGRTFVGENETLMDAILKGSLHADVVALSKKHFEESRLSLLDSLRDLLNARSIRDIQDFILNSTTFSKMVDEEMGDIKPLLTEEKLQRSLLSPKQFAYEHTIGKFRKWLGYTYMGIMAVGLARLIFLRAGPVQRLLEPLLRCANHELQAFGLAFIGLSTIDTFKYGRQYFASRKEQAEVARYYSNALYVHSFLSQNDLDEARSRVRYLQFNTILTGTLNVLFLSMIARGIIKNMQNRTVVQELLDDCKAFERLNMTPGNFNRDTIVQQAAGLGNGRTHTEARDLLLKRMGYRYDPNLPEGKQFIKIGPDRTWNFDLTSSPHDFDKPLYVAPLRKMNEREIAIVELNRAEWNQGRLDKLFKFLTEISGRKVYQ